MYGLICYRLTIICSQTWFFFGGGVEGEDVKIVCSIPKKALLCVNTRLLVYCVSKWVHRPKLWVSSKILRTKKEFLKNGVVTLAIMRRSNLWGNLGQM